MSTTEFLKGLTLEQLKYAKEEADRLIRDIESEKKVTFWVVGDTLINESCFSEDQFNEAKKKLCELIMSDDFRPIDVASNHPVITCEKVYESHVADWLKLNN